MKNKKKCLLERLIGFVSFFLTFSLKKMFEIIIFDFKIQMFAFYEYWQAHKNIFLCNFSQIMVLLIIETWLTIES